MQCNLGCSPEVQSFAALEHLKPKIPSALVITISAKWSRRVSLLTSHIQTPCIAAPLGIMSKMVTRAIMYCREDLCIVIAGPCHASHEPPGHRPLHHLQAGHLCPLLAQRHLNFQRAIENVVAKRHLACTVAQSGTESDVAPWTCLYLHIPHNTVWNGLLQAAPRYGIAWVLWNVQVHKQPPMLCGALGKRLQ